MDENDKSIKKAIILQDECVACGHCAKLCPKKAITIEKGSYANINHNLCIGCKLCRKSCPASAIIMEDEKNINNNKIKKWTEYLWIIPIIYLALGLANILFAWLGLLCFFVPLIISLFSGTKLYCNNYCGRGQLFCLLGDKHKLSLNHDTPYFLKSKLFRYGFLIFFLAMFFNVLNVTYLVFINSTNLKTFVTLFWRFKIPWNFAYNSITNNWISQFAFGFYSLMITSTLIGLILMIFFKPRSWCVICPMGTMTQLICKIKNKKRI